MHSIQELWIRGEPTLRESRLSEKRKKHLNPFLRDYDRQVSKSPLLFEFVGVICRFKLCFAVDAFSDTLDYWLLYLHVYWLWAFIFSMYFFLIPFLASGTLFGLGRLVVFIYET